MPRRDVIDDLGQYLAFIHDRRMLIQQDGVRQWRIEVRRQPPQKIQGLPASVYMVYVRRRSNPLESPSREVDIILVVIDEQDLRSRNSVRRLHGLCVIGCTRCESQDARIVEVPAGPGMYGNAPAECRMRPRRSEPRVPSPPTRTQDAREVEVEQGRRVPEPRAAIAMTTRLRLQSESAEIQWILPTSQERSGERHHRRMIRLIT